VDEGGERGWGWDGMEGFEEVIEDEAGRDAWMDEGGRVYVGCESGCVGQLLGPDM